LIWVASDLIIPRRWILGENTYLCGLSTLITFVLLIVRMENFDRKLVTSIPAITQYLTIDFKFIPQYFCAVYLLISVLLDSPLIQTFFVLAFGFFWSWLTIRILNPIDENTTSTSPNFALHTFLPE